MPQRFCRHCGIRIADEAARHCPQCGRELSSRSPSPETPGAPRPPDREAEAAQSPPAAGPPAVAPEEIEPRGTHQEPRIAGE
ncbi:MAG: hypothetical protein ACP5KN_18610, partial [Armatimonadota bacterium]